MSDRIDCTDPESLAEGIETAREALARRECVVLPTDTVYGIGADAFSPQAVAVLLAAKGRGRTMPPPVLMGSVDVLDGLAMEVPEPARELAREFWPGALTLIVQSQPTLTWDLGRPEAPSPCACRTMRSPAGCSRPPDPWPSPAPTAPACRPPPRSSRPSRCWANPCPSTWTGRALQPGALHDR